MGDKKIANEDRGEVAIKLDGRDFILRPSYQAVRQTEKLSGSSLTTLWQKAMTAGLSLDDLAAIITPGLKEGGETSASFEKVMEMIFKSGITDVSRAIIPYLVNALMGGRMPTVEEDQDDEGESQAADESTPSRIAATQA